MRWKIKTVLYMLIALLIISHSPYQTHAQQILLPDDSIWAISWSPDSSRLAFSRYYGIVEIKDVVSGEIILALESGNDSQIIAIAWSPDGTTIAGSDELTTSIYIWDANTGLLLKILEGEQTANVAHLAWNSDGTQLAASSTDYLLQIWNIETGLTEFTTSSPGQGLDWYGNKFVVGISNAVSIIDTHDDTYTDVGFSRYTVTAVAWSPDGVQVASGDIYGAMHIWNANIDPTEMILPLYTLVGHNHAVIALDWSPDGTRIASASVDGHVGIWNTSNGQLIEMIEFNDPVLTAQWSPDGSKLAYTGAGMTVHIIPAPEIPIATSLPSQIATNAQEEYILIAM